MDHPTTAGSATWANHSDIAQRYAYNKKRDFWIGRNPYQFDQAIGYDDDRHVFLCAGTGSGKGRSIVVNNLLNWQGSVVSVDPKGENASICAARRADGDNFCDGLGQKTYVLDPFNLAKVPDELRASCNLLDLLDAESPSLLDDARLLAESMRLAQPGGESESWSKDAASITTLVIAHAVSHPGVPEEQRNLVFVRKMIIAGEEGYVERVKAANRNEARLADVEGREPDFLKVPSAHEALLKLMIQNPCQDGAIADRAKGYLELMRTNKRQWGSLIKNAQDESDFIDSLNMKNQLRPDPEDRRIFSLSDLKHDPNGISIFISLPDNPDHSAVRWQKAILLLIMDYMRQEQRDPATGLKTLLCLDEFASLGKMPRIPDGMNSIRGGGVKMFIISTNIGRLKKDYEEGLSDILQGCSLQIWLDNNDPETRKFIEETFGEAQVVLTQRGGNVTHTKGEIINIGGSISKARSQQFGKSRADAKSYSESLALSESENFSTAISNVETWGETEGQSIADSETSQSSWQLSNSVGQTTNWQKSEGSSRGWNRGHQTSQSFGTSHNDYTWFKPWVKSTNDTRQRGRSSGEQGATNINESIGGGGSTNETEGTGGGKSQSRTISTQGSKSKGGSQGVTNQTGGSTGKTKSYQRGETTTLSSSYSEGFTETLGHNWTTGSQESISVSTNWQENILKRPLITRDEVNLFLARRDKNREHPTYPGFALVHISGERPFLARRCYYDQDPEFEGSFTPHPGYVESFTPKSKQRLVGGEYTAHHFMPIRIPPPIQEASEALHVELVVNTDEWFEKGDTIFTWQGLDANSNRERWAKAKASVKPLWSIDDFSKIKDSGINSNGSGGSWRVNLLGKIESGRTNANEGKIDGTNGLLSSLHLDEPPVHPDVGLALLSGKPKYRTMRFTAPAAGKVVDYALQTAFEDKGDIVFLRFERPISAQERVELERQCFGSMIDYLVEKEACEDAIAELIEGYNASYKRSWEIEKNKREQAAKTRAADELAQKEERKRLEREAQERLAAEKAAQAKQEREDLKSYLAKPYRNIFLIFVLLIPGLFIVGNGVHVGLFPDSVTERPTYTEKRFTSRDGEVNGKCHRLRIWDQKDRRFGNYSYRCNVENGWDRSHPSNWFWLIVSSLMLSGVVGVPLYVWTLWKGKKGWSEHELGSWDGQSQIAARGWEMIPDWFSQNMGKFTFIPIGAVLLALIVFQSRVGAVY